MPYLRERKTPSLQPRPYLRTLRQILPVSRNLTRPQTPLHLMVLRPCHLMFPGKPPLVHLQTPPHLKIPRPGHPMFPERPLVRPQTPLHLKVLRRTLSVFPERPPPIHPPPLTVPQWISPVFPWLVSYVKSLGRIFPVFPEQPPLPPHDPKKLRRTLPAAQELPLRQQPPRI